MADTTGIRFLQEKAASRHGTQPFGQASDGTGTSGHYAIYNGDGSLTDGGALLDSWTEEVPTGTVDGINTRFMLSETPAPGSLTLFLNIDQCEGTDFTISGNVVTFAVAPKPRDVGSFLARYMAGGGGSSSGGTGGGSTSSGNISWNEVPSGTLDGSNITFTLAQTPSPSGALQLYLNGELLSPLTTPPSYTLTGNTITLGVTPTPSAAHGDLLVATYPY